MLSAELAKRVLCEKYSYRIVYCIISYILWYVTPDIISVYSLKSKMRPFLFLMKFQFSLTRMKEYLAKNGESFSQTLTLFTLWCIILNWYHVSYFPVIM